jgi:hypothetical protein
MRPAQLGVMPGTLRSSAAEAWLMSMRSSGGGAGFVFEDDSGAPDCDAPRVGPNAAARQTASAIAAMPGSDLRACTNPLSARLPKGNSEGGHAPDRKKNRNEKAADIRSSKCASTRGHASSCRFFDSSSGKASVSEAVKRASAAGSQLDDHLGFGTPGCRGNPCQFNRLRAP